MSDLSKRAGEMVDHHPILTSDYEHRLISVMIKLLAEFGALEKRIEELEADLQKASDNLLEAHARVHELKDTNELYKKRVEELEIEHDELVKSTQKDLHVIGDARRRIEELEADNATLDSNNVRLAEGNKALEAVGRAAFWTVDTWEKMRPQIDTIELAAALGEQRDALRAAKLLPETKPERDPKTGFWICTKEHPWHDKAGPTTHPSAKIVGPAKNGESLLIKCPICSRSWEKDKDFEEDGP